MLDDGGCSHQASCALQSKIPNCPPPASFSLPTAYCLPPTVCYTPSCFEHDRNSLSQHAGRRGPARRAAAVRARPAPVAPLPRLPPRPDRAPPLLPRGRPPPRRAARARRARARSAPRRPRRALRRARRFEFVVGRGRRDAGERRAPACRERGRRRHGPAGRTLHRAALHALQGALGGEARGVPVAARDGGRARLLDGDRGSRLARGAPRRDHRLRRSARGRVRPRRAARRRPARRRRRARRFD